MRLKPEIRKNKILLAAVEAARETCYLSFTRLQVAERAGVAESLINRYFEDMGKLRQAVMVYAVVNLDMEILSQGIAHGSTIALSVDPDIKLKSFITQR